MSSQATLSQLASNPESIVDFIIDNNPQGVQSAMDSINLLPPDMPNPTRQDLKNRVMELVALGSPEASETFQYVLAVDYDAENTNYTGNMREQLEQGITSNLPSGGGEGVPSMAAAPVILLSVLNGIFQVGTSVFGWLASQENAEAAADFAQASEYSYKRGTIFGIPMEVVIAMVVVIGLVAVVALVKPKKR